MLRLRVTDGCTFGNEFSAATFAQFRIGLVSACAGVAGKLELQIQSPQSGDWVSPNYPTSNNPLRVAGFVGSDTAADIWGRLIKCDSVNSKFDYCMAEIKQFITCNKRAIMRIVK